MTPKQKAEELVKRYSCLHHGIEENLLEKVVISDYAIESALIAVDEILEIINNTMVLVDIEDDYDFYLKVKQEIEKL